MRHFPIPHSMLLSLHCTNPKTVSSMYGYVGYVIQHPTNSDTVYLTIVGVLDIKRTSAIYVLILVYLINISICM